MGVRGIAASVMTDQSTTKLLILFPQEILNNVGHKVPI
jgi:hypothetical protein